MGVTGLWKLIESSGKPVAFETLEDKVIVIDISIWLHQVVKGYTDGKGGHIHNSHLLGLFNRICKLLYFRIKPIFVFDGQICNLKWQTISKRAQQKSKLKTEAEKIEELLLQSLAKEKVIKEALGLDTNALTISPNKKKPAKTEEKDDMFKLPENCEIKNEKFTLKTEEEDEFASSKKSYNVNINKIDLKSSYFKSLAPDVRHDILVDIKETRKQNSWAKLRELPVESENFSTYQMSGLLRRRQVQVSLEEAEKEMGGKVFSLSELESLLAEDGILDVGSKHAQRIAGDEGTRFLLVRDITKAISEAKEREAVKTEPQPSTSKYFGAQPAKQVFKLEDDDDNDLELQRAIQMSLENEEDSTISEKNENSNEPIKLNAQQRKKFVGSIQSHGLVKGFMKEYGEMNDDDINDMIDATQVEEKSGTQDDSLTQKFPHTDRYVLYGTPEKSDTSDIKETPEKSPSVSFEEPSNKLESTPKAAQEEKKEIVITFDSANYSQEEDIFADIFESQADEIIPKEKEDVDVEIASISDDDTIEYEVPMDDMEELDEHVKETESGLVSEEAKILEKSENMLVPDVNVENEESNEIVSENDKFWSDLADVEPNDVKVDIPDTKTVTEKSEIEKFYEIADGNFGDVIEIADDSEQESTQVKPKTELKAEPESLQIKEPDEIIELDSEEPKAAILDEIIEEEVKDPKEIAPKTKPGSLRVKEPNEINKIDSEEPKAAIVDEIKEDISHPQERTPVKKHQITEEEDIASAAEALRMELTDEQLLKMEEDLRKQQKNYEFERNKLDRQGTSITDSMSRDCKELLKLFGIPYIDAPTEAEAQCAFLNAHQIADGIITDDSDVWLFGAKTVYKNFFLQKKIVKQFEIQDIENRFKLNRNKLIQLAMLVGSDYTVGLNGVGAVTAMEILAAFPPTEEENGTDNYQSLMSSLRKFRDWFENGKQDMRHKGLKNQLKNVELLSGFPNLNVAKAYLEPKIDTSLESFSWGLPDEESIFEFAKYRLGWTRLKTKEILDPVMKRLKERKQKKMEDYFKIQLQKRAFDEKLSKRVEKAVKRLGNGDGQEEVPDEPDKKPRKPRTKKAADNNVDAADDQEKKPRKRKAPATKKVNAKEKKEIKEIQDAVLLLSEDDDYEPPDKQPASVEKPASPDKNLTPQKNAFDIMKAADQSPKKLTPKKAAPKGRKRKVKDSEPQPSTSKAAMDEELEPKKAPRIPETKQVIPQREKDKAEQEQAKQKAIEIFKNSKLGLRKKN
ncbi:DNA excision repair protein ERCC-5 [Chironomus tepperi]|uniref:DNA excision repair protein ERCC-5 n=1 Tax=Chironomus tepperi TaxID=113505 RepID=UPI00391F1FC1